MYSSRHAITGVRDVPDTWIFEHYLDLNVKLMGQRVKVKSAFNDKDTNPSMNIYFSPDTGTYRFRCFSSGQGGSAFTMMARIWGSSTQNTAARLVQEYTAFLKQEGDYESAISRTVDKEAIRASQWNVTDFELRGWNQNDAKFWPPYNISSAILEYFMVRPLKSFTMSRVINGMLEKFVVEAEYTYGYFNRLGELCKIYQPKNPERKFTKVRDYIQGSDQLTGARYLLIQSSLKDLMSVYALGLRDIDMLAPDSENTDLPRDYINKLKEDYEVIMVMFDNDEAGIKAMQHYRKEYGVTPVLLPMEKDPSDSSKKWGAAAVKHRIVPLINQAIEMALTA